MFFERWAEKLKNNTKNNEEEEIVFKNLNDELEDETATAPAARESAAPASIEGGNIELKVVRPATFGEVSTVADHLMAGCTVVLNLELLDRPTTLRMLDFINGVTYTMDGEIKNVAQNTYIITPNGIDVRD